LHENVATGAADGYGRMAEKPAMCLLHLGVGLANGLTNLHNARRAFTPVLNVIGDHATWHRPADPLLATEVESLAHTVSDYVKKSFGAPTIAVDLVEAIEATNGGRIVTLIVPHDAQIGAAGDVVPPPRDQAKKTYSSGRVVQAAQALNSGKTALLLGGGALSESGLLLAGGSLPQVTPICSAIPFLPVWSVVEGCRAQGSCPTSPMKLSSSPGDMSA
jgi:acetolactate synthase-1/2/3 large subunit